MENRYIKIWKDICSIHLMTKHYMLIAEEMSFDSNTFLQPIKEHRDAYDHIIRVYSSKMNMRQDIDIPPDYEEKNMSKALGHEYRAFFDVADWLSIVCRERINYNLDGKTRNQIIEKYPQYDEAKAFLVDLPSSIAEMREQKDMGSGLLPSVENYRQVLDQLIEYCREIQMIF